MFTLPLHSYQQPSRPKQSNSSPRKRKRKGFHPEEQQRSRDAQITDSDTGSLASSSPSRQSSFSAVLTPDEIYQYAVAGQSIDDEMQSHPFPHAHSANRGGPSRFDYDLRQQLKPSLASSSERNNGSVIGSLHHQHMAVMTTILHRSLLEQDFVRAGRVLGIILRDETGGRPIDVRAEGRWGIGAEILIRQDAQRQIQSQEWSSSSSGEQDKTSGRLRAWFTRKGFEDAKKYYERLIVQYPFYKQNPASVSALDFYPAMFGLWIYVVHEEAKLKSLDSESAETELAGDNELQDEPPSPAMMGPPGLQYIMEEHSQAREIADRMDAVMGALPYREEVELLDLRGMVGQWIRDLEEALAMPTDADDISHEREDTPLHVLTSGVTNVSL
jgi:RNA polymerase I specific initiation factor